MQTSENTTSATSVGSDISNISSAPTTTRGLVRNGTATIQDYFKIASSSDISISSLSDATSCPTDVKMFPNLSSKVPEEKKYKITTYNGRELSLRQPEKKKIK